MDNIAEQCRKRTEATHSTQELSQGDAAKRPGVHRSRIRGIEGDIRNPSLNAVQEDCKSPLSAYGGTY